jgi:hypothetical protein
MLLSILAQGLEQAKVQRRSATALLPKAIGFVYGRPKRLVHRRFSLHVRLAPAGPRLAQASPSLGQASATPLCPSSSLLPQLFCDIPEHFGRTQVIFA